MTDLEKWKLRGRVRTLRSETAEWDAEAQAWKPVWHWQVTTFDAAGRISELDQPGDGGSVYRTTYLYDDKGRLREVRSGTAGAPIQVRRLYSYDAAGRLLHVTEAKAEGTERISETYSYGRDGQKTKVEFVAADLSTANVHYSIEGNEVAYGAPGATTLTTTYDERDRPAEVLFHDNTHAVVLKVTFTRDSEERLRFEEAHHGFPLNVQALGAMSADDQAKLLALLADALDSIATSYSYDANGRVLQRTRRMGKLHEEHTTFAYDDHDNVIEERTESRDREMHANDDGTPRVTPDVVRMHDTRYEHTYDAAGNWTERIVSSRSEPHVEFQRSNVERRTITYYDK